MGGKKKGGGPQTVGYRYFWDIHSGLGRGPVDEIVEIRVDDKTAYLTSPGEITRSKAIFINEPKLFGGEDTGGEGGVQGRMEILMGERNQRPSVMLMNLLKGVFNPVYRSSIRGSGFLRRSITLNAQNESILNPEVEFVDAGDSLVPGFRGIVSTVYSGLISCYSAYPKKHSYRVRRTHKGWQDNVVWEPHTCRIELRNDTVKINFRNGDDANQYSKTEQARTIHAMNPAHILVQCITDKSWGGKKELSDLDLDSFKVAADKLHIEKFGMCIRYNRQSSIREFMQLILDHIGAVQYEDVSTGKLAIKLIRNDYYEGDLHTFNSDNGILSVQDDDSGANGVSPNQVIVTYLDPVSNKEHTAKADNLASIQMHGVISKSIDYKGVPTYDLAAKLAQRELEMGASGLIRLKVLFDMRGNQIRPGEVYKLHLPERWIDSVVFRVVDVRNGTDEGTFEVTFMQDVFGLSSANYSSAQSETLAVSPDYTAKPVAADKSRLFEVPYHLYPSLFSEADIAYLKPTDCFVASLAVSPSPLAQRYDLLSDAGGGYADNADGVFTPSVVLLDDLSPYAEQLKFEVDGDYSGLDGAYALMIDDEILKIESVDYGTNTINIGRGCADTVPQAHAKGARVWCYLLGYGADSQKYLPGETIKSKIIPYTSQDELDAEVAPELTITTKQRWVRPYPPANVRVDGVMTLKIASGDGFTLTWSHRDRVVQGDNLIPHTQGSTTLSDTVSYTINLLDGDNVVRTITTRADTFAYPDESAVDGEQFNGLSLYAKEGNLHSLQGYLFSVAGALTPLTSWDYTQAFDVGDNLLNRYDDRDMPGGQYIMLRSSVVASSEVYKRFPLTPGQYKRFGLNYKIGTYAQRAGQCEVVVQLLAGDVVVREFKSGLLGDYPKSEWHAQGVVDDLPGNVSEVRFKITVPVSPTNNAIAFRDIILRVGED